MCAGRDRLKEKEKLELKLSNERKDLEECRKGGSSGLGLGGLRLCRKKETSRDSPRSGKTVGGSTTTICWLSGRKSTRREEVELEKFISTQKSSITPGNLRHKVLECGKRGKHPNMELRG